MSVCLFVCLFVCSFVCLFVLLRGEASMKYVILEGLIVAEN